MAPVVLDLDDPKGEKESVESGSSTAASVDLRGEHGDGVSSLHECAGCGSRDVAMGNSSRAHRCVWCGSKEVVEMFQFTSSVDSEVPVSSSARGAVNSLC